MGPISLGWGCRGFASLSDWAEVALHFRPTVYIIPAGHQLRLKLQVDGASDEWGMFAYDTADQLSLLILPTQPSS